MHGRQGNRRLRHMLSIPSPPSRAPSVVLVRSSSSSSPPFDSSLIRSSEYSFSKDGRKIRVGDCALFQAGNQPPFIGIIRWFSTGKEDHLKLCVNWLYRPADIKLAKGILLEAEPNEVFYSFHKDVIPAASLLHPCKVAFLRKGVELPSGLSSFVCRRVYDIANKCLWWLTDQDYINERQEEVDQLLDKTQLEMHAVQSGGRSPKPLNGPTSNQPLKSGADSVQNSSTSFASQANKGKKRERGGDQGTEPIKRERSSIKQEDGESGSSRLDNMTKSEVAKITEKGALVSMEGCEKLVQLMQLDKNEKRIDLAGRILLADVIASTDKIECLSRFVQLRGVTILDDWLQEAHKGKNGDGNSPKESDKGTEDLLLALLRALDKLPINLDALQTSNVGKSVNYLRSHKNIEIVKKARSLVDTWKKRVDAEMAEMTKINDAKSGGPTNQAVSCTGKPGFSEASHLGSKSTMKTLISQPSAVNWKDSPGRGGVISSGNHSELPSAIAKEEKSSNSSQSQNNSQSYSGHHPKTIGSSGKEDGRSSTASKASGSSSRHRRSSNGFVGNSTTGVNKESSLNKPVKILNQSGLSSEAARDMPGVDHGNNHRLIVRIPNTGRSPARSSSGGSLEDPPVTGSRVSSPCLPDKFDLHNDNNKIKLKGEVSRSHISSDVNIESCRSDEVKEGIVRSDAGNGSSPDDLDEETDVPRRPSGDAKEVSSIIDPNLRNSLNALIESCAKYSEPSVPSSSGDDLGMNLLASVAAGEMSSKSDLGSVSPPVLPVSSPKEEEDPCTANNEVTSGLPSETGVDRTFSQSDVNSDSKKPLLSSEKLNNPSKIQVKSADMEEEMGLGSDLVKQMAVDESKPIDRCKKIAEGTTKSSDFAGNSTGDKFKTDVPLPDRKPVPEESLLSTPSVIEEQKPPLINKEHKPSHTENHAEAVESIGTDSTILSPTSEKVPCLETVDVPKSIRSDESEDNRIDSNEGDQKGQTTVPFNDDQSGSKNNKVEKAFERKDDLQNHLVTSVLEADKGSKSDLREEVSSSQPDGVGAKLDFDLNEGFPSDDVNQNITESTICSAAPVSAPSIHLPAIPPFASTVPNGTPALITVAAPNKGPFVPPENLLKTKGGPFGWKGSAATSAFRPAEPRKLLEMPPLNSSDAHSSDTAGTKQGRMPLDIDLNVADERVLEDMASSQGSPQTAGSESGVVSTCEAPTRSAGGLDLDLNKVDEGADTAHFLSTSSSSRKLFSVGLHNGEANMSRGFDLNNGPGGDEHSGAEPLLKSQHLKNSSGSMPFPPPIAGLRMGNNAEIANVTSWFPHCSPYPGVAIPSFIPDRGEQQPYSIVPGPGSQRILSSVGGSVSGDIFRGPVLSSSPAMAFPQAPPFPYAGFPFASSFPLPSSSYSGGPPNYVDSSQFVGPGSAVSSHYVRPYVLTLPEGGMNAGPESGRKWGARGLDLNAGPGSTPDIVEIKDDRLPSVSRQLPLAGSQIFGEEQARMYQASSGGGLKRKEREGGSSWDERFYKQSSWQ